MDAYIFKYKDYYYYTDDVNGDILVSSIDDARIFSEKQVKEYDLDTCFKIGDELFCEDTKELIKLDIIPQKIKI